MNTGTVQSRVNLQMLDLKWQKKKQDINQKNNENMMQDQILMQSLERKAQDERDRAATSELYTKLKTGGTLTADEIAYLKEHDPEALADYEQAQAEKKAYKQALKNCRTKEDVERLKFNRMGIYAAQAKSIANSPYIPQDKKLELMNKLNNEVCCIRDAHMEFVKSRVYEELPKEAEIAEERAKENAAEHDEMYADQKENAACHDEVYADQKNTSENIFRETGVETNIEVPDKTPAMDSENQISEDLTFDKITQDIERFLRRNSSRKTSFATSI